MRNIIAFVTLFVVVVLTAGVSGVQAEVRTQRIVSGLDQPLFVTSDPEDADRLFILEKSGLIKVFDQASGSLLGTPFLDLSSQVSTTNEQGLLGLAFHPDYATNGQFYVNYSDSSGNLQVSQYEVSGNPNVADAASSTSVINIPQNNVSHNGGWLGFRSDDMSDGFLYIAVGDDRIGYDEIDDGMGGTIPTLQTRETLNGAVLRIDVDDDDFGGDPVNNYAIPDSNPVTDMEAMDGARREIWSYGLRNPWRPSFDSDNGDLYIADVGETLREEVNFQHVNNTGGDNYGWPHREGNVANPDAVDGSEPDDNVNPLLSYAHGDGQFQGDSVTGGYVYRGTDESVQGKYFYGDFVTGGIYSLEVDRSTNTGAIVDGSRTDWTNYLAPLDGSIDSISSFGEDALGNLFVVDFDGEIYRVDPVAEPITTSAYVDGLYQSALGRDGEAEGRDHWIGQLTGDDMNAAAMTREEVADAFWVSVENAGQRVDKLYNEILQRPADATGRVHHAAEIVDNDKSDIDIAVEMFTSFEFHRDHLSNLDFIDTVYQRALGRAPTSEEFSDRFLEMQAGANREMIALFVLETVDRIVDDVDESYESVLGRQADSAGLAHYGQSILDGTMDAGDVTASLLASQEFVYGALRDVNFGDDMFVAASASSEPFSLAAIQSIPAAPQAAQSSAAGVPEPTSAALISLGLACLAARSRRRR